MPPSDERKAKIINSSQTNIDNKKNDGSKKLLISVSVMLDEYIKRALNTPKIVIRFVLLSKKILKGVSEEFLSVSM